MPLTRNYSTSSNYPEYTPLIVYPNADLEKDKIITENKNKSGGIPLKKFGKWKDIYIGSSVDLEIEEDSLFILGLWL